MACSDPAAVYREMIVDWREAWEFAENAAYELTVVVHVRQRRVSSEGI